MGNENMKWNFWSKGNKTQEKCFSQLSTQITSMNESVSTTTIQMTQSLEQLTEIRSQIQKVARLQYKTGQDASEKLEQLRIDLDAVQKKQSIQQTNEIRIQELEYMITETANSLIKLLDDIDMLSDKLSGKEMESWQALLQQWSSQIILILQKTGIWEIELLGHTFKPQYAEAIGTMTQNDFIKLENLNNIKNYRQQEPYTVIKVIKRGYLYAGGQLLRKAQVITLQEEK
jgi:molecular chaperone GrpE (heat shock protein)